MKGRWSPGGRGRMRVGHGGLRLGLVALIPAVCRRGRRMKRLWGQEEVMDMELFLGQMMAIWAVWGDHGGITGALRDSWTSGLERRPRHRR